MLRPRRPAASGKTRPVDVVPICSSSDQEGLGSDSDDDEEIADDDGEHEEQDDSDDEDYIDSDCEGVLEEDEKASSSEEDNEENALEEKLNDEERCGKVVDLLRRKQSLDTLKLEECKSYLRRHGLRLSGTKSTCVSRILEHWRLKDGNGEILYPQSSFVINCTGDVCKGDVVLFRQRVYDKFTRRTIIGKRTIAGRVVKESYGAVKQQHTFTVEVLWSRGKNALPSLFPLLVKGRNLYRLKTFRQPWSNERERSKVLAEKHQRGALARHIRKNSKAMSMNGGSRSHQGSSADAKLNGKKGRGGESRNISGRNKKKVASSSRKAPCENTSSRAHADTVARNFDSSYNVPRQATSHGGNHVVTGESRNISGRNKKKVTSSSRKAPCENISSQAHADTVARNFDSSYNVPRQATSHGGSMRYKGSSSGARLNSKKREGEEPKHISGRKKQKVASAFAALDADANKQAHWTRNASSHNVPSNAQDTMTRNFRPSYNNWRQGINHGGCTGLQHPASLRNPVYNHNTHLELMHPTAAPPQTNPRIAYVPTSRRDGSFGMTGGVSHLPSNVRCQINHPYASAASSVNPWPPSQFWQRPDYEEHGPRILPAAQFQRFRN